MKRTIKKLVSASLVGLLVLNTPLTALASKQSTAKEEVVYGMLDGNGSVEEAYVVNIFDETGQIIDYGNYREVKNMTSKDEVKLNGTQVIVDNTEDTLYYEGILNENELPWDITLQYFIDGTEYSAEEIAGKSGALEIKLLIDENPAVDSFFYENYGVQATFVFDTEIAKNIQAEEATIANVGRNKQLSYTILPGQGADISIQADVEDFEMDAVSINGIHLNLGIDFDDAALMEKVEELLSGVNQLDQGALDLKEGAFTLKDGSSQLNRGAYELQEGATTLDQGVNALTAGIAEIDQALELLDSQSSKLTDGLGEFKAALVKVQSRLAEVSVEAEQVNELRDASSDIKEGIQELTDSLELLDENVGYDQYKEALKAEGLDIDEVKAGNEKSLGVLTKIIEKLKEASSKLKDYPDIPGAAYLAEEINQQVGNLGEFALLFQGNNAAIYGTEQYLKEVSDSIAQIYAGSSTLNASYAEFDEAITELAVTLNQLIGKVPQLTQAIDTLVTEYSKFDTGVNDYTEGVAQIIVGYQQVVNGASHLNTGTFSLKSSSLVLRDHMADLVNGTTELYSGTSALADGTNEFKEKTDHLDQEVQTEIDETLLELMGDASETISFVSDKNKQVESVQFVLKTENIKADDKEKEVITEEKENLSFWEKFKDLFSFLT